MEGVDNKRRISWRAYNAKSQLFVHYKVTTWSLYTLSFICPELQPESVAPWYTLSQLRGTALSELSVQGLFWYRNSIQQLQPRLLLPFFGTLQMELLSPLSVTGTPLPSVVWSKARPVLVSVPPKPLVHFWWSCSLHFLRQEPLIHSQSQLSVVWSKARPVLVCFPPPPPRTTGTLQMVLLSPLSATGTPWNHCNRQNGLEVLTLDRNMQWLGVLLFSFFFSFLLWLLLHLIFLQF